MNVSALGIVLGWIGIVVLLFIAHQVQRIVHLTGQIKDTLNEIEVRSLIEDQSDDKVRVKGG